MKTIQFKEWECHLVYDKYRNQRRAIQLIDVHDRELVATATVNLPHEPLEDNEVAIKDYSENNGMIQVLQSEEIIGEVKRYVRQGFVMIPICELLMNKKDYVKSSD